MSILTQAQVADLLGVKVRTLRQWRERDRRDAPGIKYLFPITPSRPTATSLYSASDVVAFCRENPEYQQRLLEAAGFIHVAIHEDLYKEITK